ncbi:MAG: aldo/keto reductase [Anaerolineales bacterium]|nr:aldo/keto reductase [Anaerolineales bacterium]
MQYRKFGSLDWEVSALSFGAMRLPVLDDKSSKINEPLATAMLRRAIDAGVNYVDTAWGYHQEQSEPFLGRALKDGYREKVHLATKMPSWLIKEAADFDRYLETQMERLDVDHLDLYLLHTLNKRHWDKLKALDVLTWAEKKMSEGVFHHFGFSFHDQYSVFESIVNDYDNWAMAQIQYNYIDVDYQAGRKGLKLAADRGMAVVIMEPLRGGMIAKDPPPEPVAETYASSERDWSPVAWALNWLWDQPEVSTTLSGMSAMEHVEENLALATEAGLAEFTDADHALIDAVRKAYASLEPIPCTQCEYCLPCPSGVAIPRIFDVYNEAVSFDAWGHGRWVYNNMIKPEERADNCTECGECEAICPQNIKIIQWLATVHERLAEPAA